MAQPRNTKTISLLSLVVQQQHIPRRYDPSVQGSLLGGKKEWETTATAMGCHRQRQGPRLWATKTASTALHQRIATERGEMSKFIFHMGRVRAHDRTRSSNKVSSSPGSPRNKGIGRR